MFVITFVIALGYTGTAFASDDKTLYPTTILLEEHYEIEIIGLNDEYILGEEYSFSFIISGYGHECATYEVLYPDENGSIVGMGAEPLCDPTMTLHEFEINYSDKKRTLGNVVIKNPGVYTVTITFDKPNKYFPTTVSKEFQIIESVMDDSIILSPLKQFKSGVSIDEIQCKESLILVKKNDGSPACVKELTLLKLVERGLIITSKAERDIMLDAGYKLYPGAGWIQGGQENESSPEPERTSDVEMQLRDAKKSLKNAYQNQLNLGPYYMKDVVIGFGTHNDILVVDIASKYTDTDSFQTVKKEIQHIVGNGVKIEYVVYDEPIERHIETVIPYMWNKILHQKNIDFAPKEMSYFNNADGFKQHDRVCSPLVASNGTEFYISSTFDLEPFEITGTFIDKTEPDDCHKVWETNVLMTEPDRITALWLENED